MADLLARLRAHPQLIVSDHSFEAVAFNLLDTIDEVLEIVTPISELHGIEIDFSVRSEIEVRLLDDRLHLKQGILDLVRNAQRRVIADDTRPKRVTLELGPAERPDWLELAVIDSGAPVPTHLAARIFEPFAQPHDSAKDGSGLGLAIAKHYFEAMGGGIDFSPTAGGPCRFVAEWPVRSDRGRPLPLAGITVATPGDDRHAGLRNMLGSLGASVEPWAKPRGQTVVALAGQIPRTAAASGTLVIEVTEPLSPSELIALLQEVSSCERQPEQRPVHRRADPRAARQIGALLSACNVIASEFGQGTAVAQLQMFLAIALDHFRGETTLMSELAGRLGLHRRTVSRHLASLGSLGTAHRRGLDLIRTAPSYDNRTKTVTLNRAGATLADRLAGCTTEADSPSSVR